MDIDVVRVPKISMEFVGGDRTGKVFEAQFWVRRRHVAQIEREWRELFDMG